MSESLPEKKKHNWHNPPARYLHPVVNDTKGRGFCGPYVVCSITGDPLSKVLDEFRDIRYGPFWRERYDKAPSIQGTNIDLLCSVLQNYGYRCTPITVPRHTTLNQFINGRSAQDKRRIIIVRVKRHPGHWLVMQNRDICDTFTDGQLVPINLAPHRSSKVHEAIIVEKDNNSLKQHFGEVYKVNERVTFIPNRGYA